MNLASNRRGQGSFLSGDLPAIIMIVLSITFFISALYTSVSEFNSGKGVLDMEAALVDASSTFLQENAIIKPSQIGTTGYWNDKRTKIEQTYGVQVYIKVDSLDSNAPECTSTTTSCETGATPGDPNELVSKKFPVALETGETELEVYPAIVTVSVSRE